MSLLANFRRSYDLMVGATITGPEVRQFVADDVAASVQGMIQAGASPRYRQFVNGVENAPLTSLKFDGTSTIRTVFSSLAEAGAFALEFAVAHSPRLSGEYADNWFFLVDTVPWGRDLSGIPFGAELALTNRSDYHRKIDVGGMRMSVAPQIIEATRQAVMRKFPGIIAERLFIQISNGYVLKGRAIRSGISYDKKLAGKRKDKSAGYIQRSAPTQTNRKDSRAGEMMTYPTLVMHEPV